MYARNAQALATSPHLGKMPACIRDMKLVLFSEKVQERWKMLTQIYYSGMDQSELSAALVTGCLGFNLGAIS